MSTNGRDRDSGGPQQAGPPASALRLTAVVNGMPADIRPHPDTPILDIVRAALDQTHNRGRSLGDWTVTNALGRLLDTSRVVREYGIEDGDTLFIQVAVGAGGDATDRRIEDRGADDPHPGGVAGGRPPTSQLADPAVSRAKFDWELAQFLQSEAAQRRRGVLVVRAVFPEVLLAFATPHRPINPTVVGALIDYTDYDHTAPSIELVDPFAGRPYRTGELPSALTRRVVSLKDTGGHPVIASLIRRVGAALTVCIPGARHYYEHPAMGLHTWAAARVNDAGSLASLVERLRTHVIDGVTEGAGLPGRGLEIV